MTSHNLDTNDTNATTAEVAPDAPPLSYVTMSIEEVSGAHDNHRVALQFSPDTSGDVWITHPISVTCCGTTTYRVVAQRVRAKTLEAEGAASISKVHITAT